MTIEAQIAAEIESLESRLDALRLAQEALCGEMSRRLAAGDALRWSPMSGVPDLPRPIETAPKRRGGRRSEAEKHAICNRAHHLRSCYAAAQEAGVDVNTVRKWIEEGYADIDGWPGNDLPAEEADDLRGHDV